MNYASDVWDVYWYEKNLQGDIVAVYSATGTKLISYEYDAWGNFTTTYHYTGSSTANYNKFTYRGYYYDPDLKMYYLQSRYYDPAICRFISPDDTSYLGANGDLVSYNLYAYCSNNPVNYTDPTGHGIITVLCVIFGIVALGTMVELTKKDIDALSTLEITVDESGSNVHIENSNQIKTPWVKFGYCIYVNHFNEQTRNVIKGSTSGLYFEWELHNIASFLKIGSTGAADNLDVGNTIFSDLDTHPIVDGNGDFQLSGVMSMGMVCAYMFLYPAEIWVLDLFIERGW